MGAGFDLGAVVVDPTLFVCTCCSFCLECPSVLMAHLTVYTSTPILNF